MTIDRQSPFKYYNALDRRAFLRAAGLGLTGAGAALFMGCGDDGPDDVPGAPEGPPEVTRVRLPAYDGSSTCIAPILAAEPFLREEGLEPEYVALPLDVSWGIAVAEGQLHFAQDFAAAVVVSATQQAFSILGGVHPGCTELFVHDGVQSLADLRGRTVGLAFGEAAELPDYAFMVTLLNFVGVPAESTVASYNPEDLAGLLQSRQIDGVLAIAPMGEELRGLEGVRVILNTLTDEPWSHHYCCVLFGSNEFIERYPIATKRTLRAFYKAVDMCATDPEGVARYVTAGGATGDYETTLRILHHLPFDKWRTLDPADTLRFHALRLREVGEISATPNDVLKRADWRFLERLRQEMPVAERPASQASSFALNCVIERPPVEG